MHRTITTGLVVSALAAGGCLSPEPAPPPEPPAPPPSATPPQPPADPTAGAPPTGMPEVQAADSIEAITITAEKARSRRVKGRRPGTNETFDVQDEAQAISDHGTGPANRMLRDSGTAARWVAPGTESYAHLPESAFVHVDARPLSTFSIDVDTASYSNVRRFLKAGAWPPVDAVRIEELVNYFEYDYPQPAGERPFEISAELSAAPWSPQHRLLRIGLQARRLALEELPPSSLVFLIDVSGSMAPRDKLPLLKRSMRMLVQQLRPEDRVALVSYADRARVVLEPTSGRRRDRILAALERLEAGGSTSGAAGIRLAYEVADRARRRGDSSRVILATDGDFNVGASSDPAMVRLVEAHRDRGTFLSVLGFGTGNLKDSKLERIADHGNGRFAYIDGLLEAQRVLVGEIGGTLVTLARDVKLQVEFNPQRVRAYRLLGYENRALAECDFDDDARDAGELGAGDSVTALYELVPAGFPSPVLAPDGPTLRYQGERRPTPQARAGELLFVRLRYREPEGGESRLIERAVAEVAPEPSDDQRFAASVAAFGMLLRGSPHAGDATLERVTAWARGARGEDREGLRAEFVRLVDLAGALVPEGAAAR